MCFKNIFISVGAIDLADCGKSPVIQTGKACSHFQINQPNQTKFLVRKCLNFSSSKYMSVHLWRSISQ
jgi:hypothetical protein